VFCEALFSDYSEYKIICIVVANISKHEVIRRLAVVFMADRKPLRFVYHLGVLIWRILQIEGV
jgi:hypothetical protein